MTHGAPATSPTPSTCTTQPMTTSAKGRIVSDGYYVHEQHPIVKFSTVTEDGRQFYKMQVNDRFVGTSEEALRHHHDRVSQPSGGDRERLSDQRPYNP